MITASRTILGLYHGYNANACVLIDGQPVVVVEKERHSRVRHAYGPSPECVQDSLHRAGLSIADVDCVAFCGASDIDTDYGYDVPVSADARTRFPATLGTRLLSSECFRETSLRVLDRVLPAVIVEHHVAHGACAFYTSGFQESLVLAFDGLGDFGRSCLIMRGERTQLDCLESVPLRIGLAFRKAGTYLYRLHGGKGFDAAGKLMALAAFGEPRYLAAARLFLDHVDRSTGGRDWLLPEMGNLRPGALSDLDSQRARDFAASLQAVASAATLALLRRHVLPGDHLCLTGGCALNVIINRDLLRELPLAALYVPPCPHDGGLGLGAGLYLRSHIEGRQSNIDGLDPFLGLTDLDTVRRSELPLLANDGLPAMTIADLGRECQVEAAVRLLVQGEVIGWCHGRPELGPRALGNRSFLADPARDWMCAHLNKRIKHREPFRPYGLSLREENVPRVLDTAVRSPYMMIAGTLRERWRSALPAVVHVDGTTRLHTVSRRANPLFWELLAAFEAASGVPGLLNTSYNLPGEPIAETVTDCLRVFCDTPIRHLFVGGQQLSKC
ncbi:carbamoyltransferase C-terminal domain-containing protein [Accumulibacter sp.]|uniref:carbamoyltransferase C-terminal domain-containing protein n=1 Tax=Accumulibacter sp. TaxID=2053492 RepID=UPI002CFAB9AA|nr:carbamoyltransferase C-terminal domain-containing protein [Accumulibacter sp.]HNC22085.1 carbamoyltransferase C-terminal domain-containing protein [Accumulibacter sp.]